MGFVGHILGATDAISTGHDRIRTTPVSARLLHLLLSILNAELFVLTNLLWVKILALGKQGVSFPTITP